MNIRKITATGVFAAAIFVTTYLIKVPVPSGYIHLGDALIYVSAGLLGGPWAMLAGAIGAGIADIVGGYAMYAPATIIIKALLVVPFMLVYKKNNKLFSFKSVLMTIVAGIITVGGYYIADLIIDKAFALADIPGNVIQAVGSAVVFAVLAFALDKTKIKKVIGG